jgi:hypothetical protein
MSKRGASFRAASRTGYMGLIGLICSIGSVSANQFNQSNKSNQFDNPFNLELPNPEPCPYFRNSSQMAPANF